MADFAGTTSALLSLDCDVTPVLATNVFPVAPYLGLSSLPVSGAFAAALGVTLVAPFAGGHCPMFGGELWEKIIVSPVVIAPDFVLSALQYPVSVWSTHDALPSRMADIQSSGYGGVQLANPFGKPLTFWPKQAREFTLTIPQDGDAEIDEFVVFLFDDIDASTTAVHVTGMRVVTFAFEPDWTDPVSEKMEYATQVLEAQSGSEQRIQLRKHPRPVHVFRIFTTSADETTRLEAVLAGWQSRIFGVPLWAEAQPLAGNCAAGALAVAVDTSHRLFSANGLALLWRDPATCEPVSVLAVHPASLTLSSPTAAPWPADGRTFVIPLAIGRLPESVELRKPSIDSAEADVEFRCEVV